MYKPISSKTATVKIIAYIITTKHMRYHI